MSVITISREAGSGGTAIAEAVAAALGYRFVDKNTIGALLAKYGLVSFDRVYDGAPDFWEGFDAQKAEQREDTIAMMNKAILAIAKLGDVVIVGRGGYAVLGGFADVLNVRIQAPFAARVKKVQLDLKTADYKIAERDVRDRDRIRGLFMQSVYELAVEPVSAFDLVVNTEKIPEGKTVDLIVRAARELDRLSAGAEKLAANLDIDPVLAGAVAEALK